MSGELHLIVDDFLLKVLQILYKQSQPIDVVEVFHQYADETSKRCKFLEIEDALKRGVGVGYIESSSQSLLCVQGTIFEKEYILPESIRDILERNVQAVKE